MKPPKKSPGMQAALDALKLPAGPVPPDYRPPVSTFPMTPTAREARRLKREGLALGDGGGSSRLCSCAGLDSPDFDNPEAHEDFCPLSGSSSPFSPALGVELSPPARPP